MHRASELVLKERTLQLKFIPDTPRNSLPKLIENISTAYNNIVVYDECDVPYIFAMQSHLLPLFIVMKVERILIGMEAMEEDDPWNQAAVDHMLELWENSVHFVNDDKDGFLDDMFTNYPGMPLSMGSDQSIDFLEDVARIMKHHHFYFHNLDAPYASAKHTTELFKSYKMPTEFEINKPIVEVW